MEMQKLGDAIELRTQMASRLPGQDDLCRLCKCHNAQELPWCDTGGARPKVTPQCPKPPGDISPSSGQNNITLLDQVDKEREWLQFDDNADFILDATAKGDAEQDNDHHQFQPSR